MTDKTQIAFAVIIIGILFLLSIICVEIRELHIKLDRNAEAVARLEKKMDKKAEAVSKNAESIARLEGILIGDNLPVPAADKTAPK